MLLFLIGALGLTALVVYLAGRYPGSLESSYDQARLTERLLWIALLGSALAVRMWDRPALALRHTAVWVAIGAALVLAYSFRFEAAEIRERLVAEVFPSRATPQGEAMTFRAGANGQFTVEALVNGVRVRMLVDTGATEVALTLRDAERIGIDPAGLNFNIPIQTANGVVFAAPARLDEISVGAITLRNVEASISQGELTQSLLGMSFLGRLSSYEISRDTLTFRP